MRIVLLIDNLAPEMVGGVENHVRHLAKALQKRGNEVHILQTEPYKRVRLQKKKEVHHNKHAHSFGGLLDIAAKFFAQLACNLDSCAVIGKIHRLHPDIIHQHMYLPALLSSWRLTRTYPVVFTNHTGAYIYLNRYLPTRLLQRLCLRMFCRIIAPSRELLPRLKTSRYIPNGVDPVIFHPRSPEEKERLRSTWNGKGKFICLCPRRWAPTKGILYFVEAIALLPTEVRRKCIFLFAGNQTPEYERYRLEVSDILDSVRDTEIHLLGNVSADRLAELMALSDLCVFPSLLEATSLACLESMACGTPVLGTITGGLPELIEDGRNGWLVPIRDPAAIASKLVEIIAHPDKMKPISASALKLVNTRYTWEIIAGQTEAVYQEALRLP